MSNFNTSRYDGIPELLKSSCSFCCWRRENRNGRDTKVPYTPTSGNLAKSNKPETFRPFEVALQALLNSQKTARPYDGLGICVAGDIGAIDIDHCINEDGSLNEVATAVLGTFNDCYFEVSPSGSGLHGFFRLSPDFKYDPAHYYMKNSTNGLEIYLPGYTSRFLTVTGNTYQYGTISADMDALQIILANFMIRDLSDDHMDSATIEAYSLLSDEQVIEKASASGNGDLFKDLYEGNWQKHIEKYPSQSEADMAFASMLAFWCGCDFEQMDRIFEASGLYRSKWDRQQSGSTYGSITLENAIKKCKQVYSSHASAADDFEVLPPDDYVTRIDGISKEVAEILRMDDSAAVQKLKELLEVQLTASDYYSDTTIALLVRTADTAPYLYDELRAKKTKTGVRLRIVDKKVKELQEKVLKAKATSEISAKPVPDFIVFNLKNGSWELDPPKLAAHVRNNLDYLLVKNKSNDLGAVLKYIYEGGCYHLCDDDRMKGFIKKFIMDYDESFVYMPKVEEVYKQICTDLEITDSALLNKDESIINFRNGILHLDTMELQPHSPDILSTTQIDCNWNGSEEPTPVFDLFMETFTDGREDVKKLLLQFMGVCFSNIKGWRLKKSLFITGEGDTGKSQLKGLTERILGPGNFFGIDLAGLEGRFGTSAIYGKRLCGSSDMKFMSISEMAIFKQCTGGDPLFAEFKNLPLFSFIYDGLLWFCANRAPKFGGDQGDWVYNRIMLVDCPNVIPEEKRDHNLIDKLYAERDGIVYKAVIALKEVIANGYRFDEPEIVLQNRHSYKVQNNSALQFLEECMQERSIPALIKGSDSFTVKRIYDVYTDWCSKMCDGYSSKFSEFRTMYAYFCGKPEKNCIGLRNGKSYMLFHELTPEMYEEVRLINDPVVEKRYPAYKPTA